ncbi:TetR/AcrR family transcriptional regulator [Salipiger sp.]|uniref:TetR/AcrR family transcriptional regulator n=1 Tax=Salipiger sp. TaxID=2078585 RepID=UPI003A96CAE3
MSDTDTADCPADKRRHAAGEDPKKRDQILNGAWRVFMDQGFDAASMNSICKAAGVSKGTIYVYFQNKEDLFVALVEKKRQAFFEGIGARLTGAGSIEAGLMAYATSLGELMTSDDVIRAQRIVIGVVERMPELGQRFFDSGARHFLTGLSSFLRSETAAGRLDVPDPDLASQQFVELATAGLWRQRLFGRQNAPSSPDDIAHVAREAVRVFLAAYRPAPR